MTTKSFTVHMQQKIIKHIENISNMDLKSKAWNYYELSELTTKTKWRYYPFTEKYYFELNPSFVSEYKGIDEMSRYSFIMLRDGFIGLFYFFLKNIKPPKDLKTQFLIPAEFSYLVPSFWLNNVLLYSFESKNISSEREVAKSYIYGPMVPETFFDRAEERFKELASIISTKETTFISPFRHQGYFDFFNNSKYTRECYQELYKHFPASTKIEDDFTTFSYNNVGQSDEFVGLDKNHFYIYDDFLFHFFSSKGAKFLGEIPSSFEDTEEVISLDLSLFHKIKVHKSLKAQYWILDKKLKFKLEAVPIRLDSPIFYSESEQILKKELQK